MCIYINTEYWPEHSFKVFQPLTVVEKRFTLDVAGILNLTGMRKLFTSVAGFLNLPTTGLLIYLVGKICESLNTSSPDYPNIYSINDMILPIY